MKKLLNLINNLNLIQKICLLKADKWIRKFVDDLFEWVEKKNLRTVSSIILLIMLGILAQLGIIPKLIT